MEVSAAMQAARTRSPKPKAAPRAGRKPDPTIDARLLDAAITVYAGKGWAGFNFDSVARTAGVGKAAIYRRWGSRDQLLASAISSRWEAVVLIDKGSLEADLMELCSMIMDRLLSSHGALVMNLQADAVHHAAARKILAALTTRTGARIQAMLRRAVDRGEIAARHDLAVVSHMITGTITSRVGRSVDGSAPLSGVSARAFNRRLVALLITALSPVTRATG
jgi:AcrR family transcriptional regulator